MKKLILLLLLFPLLALAATWTGPTYPSLSLTTATNPNQATSANTNTLTSSGNGNSSAWSVGKLGAAPRTLIYWEGSSVTYGPVATGTTASANGGVAQSFASIVGTSAWAGGNVTYWNDGIPSSTSAMALARYSGTGNGYNGIVVVPNPHVAATTGTYTRKIFVIDTAICNVNDVNTNVAESTSMANFVAITGSAYNDGYEVYVLLWNTGGNGSPPGTGGFYFNQAIRSGTGSSYVAQGHLLDESAWLPNPNDTTVYSTVTSPILVHNTIYGAQVVAAHIIHAFSSAGGLDCISGIFHASFNGADRRGQSNLFWPAGRAEQCITL